VSIGRWKGEEKSLFGTFGSPPKVVCRSGNFYVGCGNEGLIWISKLYWLSRGSSGWARIGEKMVRGESGWVLVQGMEYGLRC
jgi:hypothetical protein